MKLKNKIKAIIRDISGYYVINNSINSLYYFLNECVDIKKFPKAKGELRQLQECDLALLMLLDKIFKKHNLTYWLSYGTLLGAVRHEGFIPWDDDLDIAMPRSDYDKVANILQNEFKNINLELSIGINPGTKCYGVGVAHSKTGIYCDIFCIEELSLSSDDALNLEFVESELLEIKKASKVKKSKYICQAVNDDVNFYCPSPFTYQSPNIYKKEDIFPLKVLNFEGVLLNVPNNYEKFLINSFGEDYISFPRSGVLHHGNNGLPLYKWASLNKINMNELKSDLLRALDEFE